MPNFSPITISGHVEEQAPANKVALATMAVLYFVLGLITCLNDTLVPYFRKQFTLSYTQSSLVQFYFFLTYGLISLPVGKIVSSIGYKKGMISGFLIAACGGLFFIPAGMMNSYALFLAALFVMAIGIVVLQVSANPYITLLGPAQTASSRLTFVQAVGSLGTTVAPIIGSHLILSQLDIKEGNGTGLSSIYIGISGILVLATLIISRVRFVHKTPVENSSDKSHQGLTGHRNLMFGVPAIFFYVGAEVTIGTFLTNYIVDIRHVSESQANRSVALYWGSMLVGRFIGSAILKRVKPSAVLTVCGVMAAILLLCSINGSGEFAVWSMILIGLMHSVMFAIIFSLAIEGLGKHTLTASGLLSSAICGGAVISFLTGVMKDHFSWGIAFAVPLFCYLYIIFYAISGYKMKT